MGFTSKLINTTFLLVNKSSVLFRNQIQIQFQILELSYKPISWMM